jgi:hypothetical protein
VEYETAGRHYAHIDCPGHADYIKNMITGKRGRRRETMKIESGSLYRRDRPVSGLVKMVCIASSPREDPYCAAIFLKLMVFF